MKGIKKNNRLGESLQQYDEIGQNIKYTFSVEENYQNLIRQIGTKLVIEQFVQKNLQFSSKSRKACCLLTIFKRNFLKIKDQPSPVLIKH